MSNDASLTPAPAEQITWDWQNDPRWENITRDYNAEGVIRLRGSVQEEHSQARP